MTETAQELVIEREFDAPRALVYRAFVDPDQLAAWFGPVGYSVPRDTVEIDARPGGRQRFVMVSDTNPDERSPVDATFTEVIEHELLMGEEHVEGIPGFPDGVVMRIRLEFHDAGEGRTRLVVRQGPYDPTFLEMARAGWESSFTKLDGLLAA
jgi:uncharacterized protein YndB with AHSA1/START domain